MWVKLLTLHCYRKTTSSHAYNLERIFTKRHAGDLSAGGWRATLRQSWTNSGVTETTQARAPGAHQLEGQLWRVIQLLGIRKKSCFHAGGERIKLRLISYVNVTEQCRKETVLILKGGWLSGCRGQRDRDCGVSIFISQVRSGARVYLFTTVWALQTLGLWRWGGLTGGIPPLTEHVACWKAWNKPRVQKPAEL